MAQIPKFVYVLIIFLSMFLIVTYCGGSQVVEHMPIGKSFLHTIIKFSFIWDERYFLYIKTNTISNNVFNLFDIVENEIPCHWDEDCEVHLPCELPLVSKCINHNCECVWP
jgi:hypothetical protein